MLLPFVIVFLETFLNEKVSTVHYFGKAVNVDNKLISMQWDEGRKSVCLIIASLCSFTFILRFWQTIEIQYTLEIFSQLSSLFRKFYLKACIPNFISVLIFSFRLLLLKCSWVTSTINSFQLQWTFSNQPTTTSNINLMRSFIHKDLA